MKKVLVGLLALAVAGGSAFAQGWTFQGYVNSGTGVFFGADVEDPRLAFVGTDGGPFASRAELTANYVNADRTAGIDLRLRSAGGNGGIFQQVGLNFASGWLSFADNMFTVHGGFIDNGFFAAQDRMFSEDSGEGAGLLTIIQPIENLYIGLGAFIGVNAATQGAFGGQFGTINKDHNPLASISVRYEMPDVVRVTAGFRNTNDVGAGVDDHFLAWDGASSSRQYTQGYLSFALLGLQDMHLGFTARLQRLEDFGDDGLMRFYLTFGHTGLVDGLGLQAGASFGMSMNDNLDQNIWVWAGVDYAVSERIVPLLNVHFVMGGEYAAEWQIHRNAIRNGVTFDGDQMFINLQPAVQFKVSPAAYCELGGIINIDLGDNATWIVERLAATNKTGVNAGVYALVNVRL